MKLLENKVALVTGGSRGIGKAIAMHFAEEGASVAITYTSSSDQASVVVKAIESAGGNAVAVKCDSSVPGEVIACVNAVIERFTTIDILVNNAGITRDTLLLRMSESDWDAVLDVNLKGAFLFTKEVMKTMMRNRSGKIINISSIVGLIGNPGQANYVASKAGLIGFTKAVAKEIASRNVTVNCIAPGFVRTDMTDALKEEQKQALLSMIPLKRFSEPEEIAAVAAFLASGKSDYITGQVICVDGGMVM